nr:hypothetical transcript [Hymenolepis microstoma]
MGSQQSILEGGSVGLPQIGLGDRHGSLVSLPGVSLPLSSGIRPALSHSTTIRFRSDSPQKRRQRPVSCVIPDPGTVATPQSQIVVVSQGPRNLYRSSSTPKVFGSSGKWREDPQWEVYQLEHRVPKFEPLAKWKDLEGCNSTPLVEMVEIYKKHYSTAAEIVLRKQDEILRLERKLEYESRRALESMQLRQRGGGFQTALQQNTSLPSAITKAAGIYQLGRINKGIAELNRDRHGSLVSLPGVSLPLSSGIRPALSHSTTIRFRSDSPQKRRQRPVSCVIPDPGTVATPQSQIVVVSQGPRNLYRSSSTPKVFGSSGKWREDPQWEVYQLEHRVPKFEPLAKWKDLEGCNSTPLVEMVEIYKKHYSTAAEIVLRKQDEILRLERKLEYESRRALESMQLRQRGGGFQTALQQNTSLPSAITKAAGIYQLGRINKGIAELNSRFRGCEKLLNDLKLQAEEIDHVLGPEDEKV